MNIISWLAIQNINSKGVLSTLNIISMVFLVNVMPRWMTVARDVTLGRTSGARVLEDVFIGAYLLGLCALKLTKTNHLETQEVSRSLSEKSKSGSCPGCHFCSNRLWW